MMMMSHVALALTLIAFSMGMLILFAAEKESVCCKNCKMIAGYFVVIVSLIIFACTAYNMVKHCGKGGMMRGDCPMMKMMERGEMPPMQGMPPPEGMPMEQK